MINSKLADILRTFSKNELNEFEKFISSPFFSKGRNYVPFISYIKKYHPKFDNEELLPENIYSKLYPGRKYNKQVIWNITSSLQKMAEEFLIYRALERRKHVKNSLLADEFLNRKLSHYQAKKLDEMEKDLEKIGISENYFKFKTELESGRMLYHFLEDTQHLLSQHIIKKGENAIMHLMRELSGVVNDLKANAYMFNAEFTLNLPLNFVKNLDLENIIIYARKNKFENADVMDMLYCSIMMVLKFEDEKFFIRLKELFERNIDKFSVNEKISWITTLANYCSMKGNFGITDFREYQFEINNLELKVGYSNNNKNIPKILFIQILRNALTINKTDWALDYINEYAPRLKPSFQKSVRALAMAFLNLKLKNFDKVIGNLKDVKFIDSRDKYYVKTLYIRAYYELKDTEQLLYQIDSAKHFISSANALSQTTRTNFLRFLNALNSAVIAQEKNDEATLAVLKKKLDADKEMPFANWLLEKLNE